MTHETPGQPSRWAMRIVEVALLALPPGEVRRRYERELIAEMYDLPVARQFRHALSILAGVWSLRRAVLTAGLRSEEGIRVVIRRRPLRCRLNYGHRWVWEHTPESTERYRVCEVCGKDGPGGSTGAMANGMISGSGTIGASGNF